MESPLTANGTGSGCFWMYDPKGGECNGYIFKAYTELD